VSTSSHTRPPRPGSWEEGREERLPGASLASWEPPAEASTEEEEEIPLPLLALVEEAQRASGTEREALAAQVNQQLEVLTSEEDSREVADLLHHLLEGGQLTALMDVEGHSCRGVAVEALLALGYPYALEVRPEDLEHLREGRKPQATPPWALGGAFLTLAVGLVGQWLRVPPGPQSGGVGGLMVLQGLMLLSLVAATQGPGRSALGRVGLGALALLSLIGVILGLFGGYYGAVAGGSGLLACLLLWLARR
jgi:hypothetical protein